MTEGPSAQSGLALAFELLVAELSRKKAIDPQRFVKELETAAGALEEQSEAARLLRLMALQLRNGVKR